MEELSLCVSQLMPVTLEREKFYIQLLNNSDYISRVQNFERKNEAFEWFGFDVAYQ